MRRYYKLKMLGRYFMMLFKIKYGYHLDYPLRIWIDTTNKCNLRCVMCPQSKGLQKEKLEMDIGTFVRIIDQVSTDKHMQEIILHMSGEPLLNKKLIEMIKYAKSRRNNFVVMHTNATLLDREISIRILQSSLDFISFSFDGCSPEIYENLRVGASFEKVKSQIETFLRLRCELKCIRTYIAIEIIRMKETEKFIPDFIKYWKNKGVDRVIVRDCMTWLGLVDDHRIEHPKNFGHKPCKYIFATCSILTDGTVVPCCMDVEGRLPLGNILKQPFSEIWNGANYNQLRRYHLTNNIPESIICHNCYLTWSSTRKEYIRQKILRRLGVY